MATTTRRGVLKGGIVAAGVLAGTYDPPSIRQLFIPKTALAISPWTTAPLPFSGPIPPPLPPSDTPVLDAQVYCEPIRDGIRRGYAVIRVAGTTEPLEIDVLAVPPNPGFDPISSDGPSFGTIQPGGVGLYALWIARSGTTQGAGSGPIAGGNFLISPFGQHTIRLRRASDNATIIEVPFVVPFC